MERVGKVLFFAPSATKSYQGWKKSNLISISEDHLRPTHPQENHEILESRKHPKQLTIGHRFTAVTSREGQTEELEHLFAKTNLSIQIFRGENNIKLLEAIQKIEYLPDWKTIDKKLGDLAQQRLSNIQNSCDY